MSSFYEIVRDTRLSDPRCSSFWEAADFAEGAEWAAGWMIALVEMAEAIRHTRRYRNDPLYAALHDGLHRPSRLFEALKVERFIR